jgi:formiminoglutamase
MSRIIVTSFIILGSTMSGASSSAVAWFTRLEPVARVEDVFRRPDDPRLGEVIEPWRGDLEALTQGRAVLVGFPHDEGVRRNHGRPGAAEAPHEIRRYLARLTPWEGAEDIDLTRHPPLDAGNVRHAGSLEATQDALGQVIAGILATGAVPVVLGGGHETAYGHYLGYVAAAEAVAILNIDAHLDVRPYAGSAGNSGTPFRQVLEHPVRPLPDGRYVCLGAQPHAVSREHLHYVRQHGGVVRWCGEVKGALERYFTAERNRLSAVCHVYVTIDADAVQAADVPGVSAPNPLGLAGAEVAACARLAGRSPAVSSLDLVEINPQQDCDGRSARWAALVVWNFLCGLAKR